MGATPINFQQPKENANMKEYTLIRMRTLSEPHIVILFSGTMLACQYYKFCHAVAVEQWTRGGIGEMPRV